MVVPFLGKTKNLFDFEMAFPLLPSPSLVKRRIVQKNIYQDKMIGRRLPIGLLFSLYFSALHPAVNGKPEPLNYSRRVKYTLRTNQLWNVLG